MGFDAYVLAHARVSSKLHAKITIDDKMSFFQQLSTLVCSGTPLLQALRQAAEQSQSMKLRTVLEEIAARVASGSSFNGAAAAYPNIFEPYWVEVIRTGRDHRPDGHGPAGVEQADSRVARDATQGHRVADVSADPDHRRRPRRDGHALDGGARRSRRCSRTWGPSFRRSPSSSWMRRRTWWRMVLYVIGAIIVAVFALQAIHEDRVGQAERRRVWPGRADGRPAARPDGHVPVRRRTSPCSSRAGVPMLETLTTLTGRLPEQPDLPRRPGSRPGPSGGGPPAGGVSRGNRPVLHDADEHGPHRRGVGPARPRSWNRSRPTTRRRWRA